MSFQIGLMRVIEFPPPDNKTIFKYIYSQNIFFLFSIFQSEPLPLPLPDLDLLLPASDPLLDLAGEPDPDLDLDLDLDADLKNG